MDLVLVAMAGAFLGGLLTWLVLRSRAAVWTAQVSSLAVDLNAAREQASALRDRHAASLAAIAGLESTLAHERRSAAEKLQLVDRATAELREAFQALAAEALRSNNQSFLALAKANLEKFQSEAKGDLEARHKAVENLVSPIAESLSRVDAQIQQIEKDRSQAYGTLSQQVRSLIETQQELRSETGNLVRALRAPAVRGRWGEIQLRRVVELAGMVPYCDFLEQETFQTADGRMRPDVIVKLPGGKIVVVDAKTPLEAYLRAAECTDDVARRGFLEEHARQVRIHLDKLSAKRYHEQFDSSPEFVVMFLPGETFFSAALEHNPALIEEGVSQGVIPASPTTLIALLRAVAYGWRQEKLAENARQISALGQELHERLKTMAGHMDNLRKGLDKAVESYNRAAGSLESRVMVSARKFPELGAAIDEAIPELNPIETTTRTLALEFEDEEETAPPPSLGDIPSLPLLASRAARK